MADSYFRQRVRQSGGLTLGEDAGAAAIAAVIGWLILDRQSAAENAIGAIVIGLGGAAVWQFVRLVFRFVWTAPRAMHAAIESERDAALARIKQLEAGKPISRAEWMEMAALFEKVQDLAVRADWSSTSAGESWRVCGGMPVAVRQAESLCKRAGTMLLASPRVTAGLADRVRAERDPLNRWLEFLRDRPGGLRVTLHGWEGDSADGHPVYGGAIDNLPTTSAHVCVECSAQEI